MDHDKSNFRGLQVAIGGFAICMIGYYFGSSSKTIGVLLFVSGFLIALLGFALHLSAFMHKIAAKRRRQQ